VKCSGAQLGRTSPGQSTSFVPTTAIFRGRGLRSSRINSDTFGLISGFKKEQLQSNFQMESNYAYDFGS
jgi:hypothetical protein